MRLTSKTRHGVRALFDIAYHCRGSAAQAKEIAERQGIPLRYLEQVLQELRRGGVVDAKRGPSGGYALARPAREIRLGDVVRTLQGPVDGRLADADGGDAQPDGRRRKVISSSPHDVDVPALIWREVSAGIAALLDGISLQDFVARAEQAGVKRAVAAPVMYFI